MLGKHVQNQGGTIQDPYIFPEFLLELPLVPRRELLVEENHIRQGLLGHAPNLFDLTGPDICPGIRRLNPLSYLADNGEPSGCGEQAKLAHRIFDAEQVFLASPGRPHHQRSLARHPGWQGLLGHAVIIA